MQPSRQNFQKFVTIVINRYRLKLLPSEEFESELDVGEEEDVPLSEFLDEIDSWIIDVFKQIGCDTAKSVLELDVKELAKRTDLEENTIEEVQNILKSEFDNN